MTLTLENATSLHRDSLRQTLEEGNFRDQAWLATERKLIDYWLDEFLPAKSGPTPELDYDPLQSRFLQKALLSLKENLNGPQFLSAWQSWLLLRRDLEVREFANTLLSSAESFSKGLAQEMETIFPTEDRAQLPEREKLEEALTAFVRTWSEAAIKQSAARTAWEVIRQFHLQVTRRLRAPLQYWQILVARMDLQAAERMQAGRAHPWQTSFRVIEETLFFQTAIRRFYDALEEAGEDAKTYSWLPACASLRACPTVLFERMTLRADCSWFSQSENTPPDLEEGADWRRLLRREVERSDLDFMDEGRRWLSSLLGAPERMEALLGSAEDALGPLADSLSQGMKGADAAPTMRNNLRFLLSEAIWAGTLADAGLPSRANFFARVVEFGGLDLSVDAWRKLTQMVASLRKLVSDTPSLARISAIDWLLGELDEHRKCLQSLAVYEKEHLPRFTEWVNSKVAGTERRQMIERIEERVRVDLRLLGAERAAQGTLHWLTREELPYLESLPDDSLAALLHEGARILDTGARGRTIAADVLNAVAAGSERATAGFRLLEGSWEMGGEIAAEVFRLLPEYASKVGEDGLHSCQRDNALTLGKVAELLLDGSENPGEQLNEWWNSLVGSYVATRPQNLFHITLNTIFSTLTRHLNASEAMLAFGPVQFVYRESLGIECRAAKAAVVPKPLGRLGRKLLEDRPGYHSLFLAEESGESPDNALVQDTRSIFRNFLAEVNVRGDIEIAARPFMGDLRKIIAVHGAPAIARETMDFAQNLVLGEGLVRWPILETARLWVKIIEQVAFALLLEAHREEIALYFGQAMTHYMPDHFAHLSREAAVSKCQRDQRILLSNWSRWLSRETPTAAWLAGFRYYLEMLLPFVDYPAVIWQMSARTIEKFLCTRANSAEYGGLCTFVAQMEKMSHGLAEASGLSRKYFDLEDYTFSADLTEENASRSLLAAAMACAAAGSEAPLDARNLAIHFVLSDALEARATTEDVSRLAGKIRKALGDRLRPAVDAAMRSIEEIVKKVSGLIDHEITSHAAIRALRPQGTKSDSMWKALLVASCTDPEAQAIAARDNTELLGIQAPGCPSTDLAETLFSTWLNAFAALTPDPSSPPPVVSWCGLLSAFLHPVTPDAPLHASAFKEDLAERLAQVARYTGADLSLPPVSLPDQLSEILQGVVPIAAQWTVLREITADVSAAIAREGEASQSTAALLDRLESGRSGPYSELPAEQYCDRATNERAFEFVFRRLGRWGADLPTHPPVVFLGDPLENYTRFNTNVVNNAFAQITGQLRKEANSSVGRIRASAALAAMALRETPASGPLWHELTANALPEAAFFKRFEAKIPELVEVSLSAAAIRSQTSALVPVVAAHLGLFCHTLGQSGDFETAVEAFKGALATDFDDSDGSLWIAVYEALALEAPAIISGGEGLFWSYLLDRLGEALREFLLGAVLLRDAETTASELCSVLTDTPTEEARAFAFQRDIRLFLLMLGGTLAREGRTRGSLNTVRFVLETGLSGEQPHALQSGGAIVQLELLVNRSLSTKLRPLAHQVFGFWGHVFGQSGWMGRFWKEATPPAVEALVRHGHTRDSAIDLLSGLFSAALAPNEGSFAASRSLLVRNVLGHSAFGASSPISMLDVPNVLRSAWEKTGLALPGPVGRRLIEMPAIAELAKQCVAKRSSTFIRFVALMGKERLGRPLWRASLFARLDAESGFFQTDPLDAVAAREAGLDLPEDRTLQGQVRIPRSVKDLRGLRLVAPPPVPQGGLMGLFKKAPVEQTPATWNDPALRRHVERLIYALLWKDILGDSGNAMVLAEALPQLDLRAYDFSTEASEELFWKSLQSAAEAKIGEGHPLSSSLGKLAGHGRRRHFSEKLAKSGKGSQATLLHFVSLYLLGERTLSEGLHYGPGETPADVLRRALEILEKPDQPALHPVAAELRRMARQS